MHNGKWVAVLGQIAYWSIQVLDNKISTWQMIMVGILIFFVVIGKDK